MGDLRERIESAIRRHLEWPESENLTGPITDDVMREIEAEADQVIYVRDCEHPERLPTAYRIDEPTA